jgi:hypothetical protein
MYAAIRRDCLADPLRRDEVAKRLHDGVLPVLREAAGCVAAYIVAAGDASIVCVALNSDMEGAVEAATRMATWVEGYLAELIVGPALVVVGLVLTESHEPI